MFKFFSIKPTAEDFDADTGTYADGMTDRFYRDLTGRSENRFRSAHERDYGVTREVNEFAAHGAGAN
jgi:hypothetical protein